MQQGWCRCRAAIVPCQNSGVCSKAGGGDKLMDVSVSVSDMEEAIQSNDDQCVRNLTNLSLPVGL